MTNVSNDLQKQSQTHIKTITIKIPQIAQIAQTTQIKMNKPVSQLHHFLFYFLLMIAIIFASGCSPTSNQTADSETHKSQPVQSTSSNTNDSKNNHTNNDRQTQSTSNPTQTGTQANAANKAVDLAEIDKLLGEKTPKVPTVNKKTGQLSVAPNAEQNPQQTDNQSATNSQAMSQDNSYAKAISKGLAIGFNYELQNDDHWTDKQRNCFGKINENFLTNDIQQILLARLTPAELNYLNDFQRSPVGRKINKWAENNVDAFIDGIDPDVDDLNLTTKETLLVISFAASPTERKLKQFINEDSLGLLMLSKTQYKMVNCGMI